MSTFISEKQLLGIRAISFGYKDYQATLLPDYGANLIALKNNKMGISFLRTLENIEDKNRFVAMPVVYGTPVLFPPNRIQGGSFQVNEKTYQFPINEPLLNNSIHGFLYNQPWKVTEQSIRQDCVSLTTVFTSNKQTSFFHHFPHSFKITMVYSLSDEGLLQNICIRNMGTDPMPLGIGFHTAFQIPFLEKSRPEDCKLFLSVDKKWIMKNRLPDGSPVQLSQEEKDWFFSKGLPTHNYPVVCQHFSTCRRRLPFVKEINGAIIADTAQRTCIVYDWDDQYSFAMLWNGDGLSHFLCVEPQSWVVNAPNVPLDSTVTGMLLLQPNHEWKANTKIYALQYT